MTATANLLYVYDFVGANTEFDDAVDYIPATGGSPTTDAKDVGDSAGVFGGLASDSAAGVYFITSIEGNNSYIYEEKFGQAAQFTAPLGGAPVATSLDDDVTSLAINASDDILYFASGVDFYEEKFPGADFSGTPTKVELAVLPNSTDVATDQIAFDQADNSAYFAAPGEKINFTTNAAGTKVITTGSVSKNFIYKVSDVTASAGAGSLNSHVSVVNLGGPNDQLPFKDGLISGVALDSKTDTLYITTRPGTLPASTNTAGIYAYKISNGQLSTVWSEAVTSSTKALTDMTYITVDPTTGDYYVSDGEESDTPGIYAGNVADIGVAPTLLLAVAPPQNGEASGDVTDALAIDDPPTVSGATVTAIDGNAGRTTGTVTTADTVTISVAFSQNVFVTGTPSLALNDGGSASYSSGSGTSTLSFSYKPSSGQNIGTLAATGVSGGAIANSAGTLADLTNAAQTFSGLRVQTTPPSLSVTGETAEVLQGAASATTLLQSDLVTDPDGSGSIAKATISISNAKAGDELSIAGLSNGKVDGGAVTVTGDDTAALTLTGDDSLAEYQTLLKSVTYQDTGSDMTTQGHPTRTVDWTVDDGALSSNTATSTVTIDRAPTLTAGATALFDPAHSSPAALDPGLSIADLDQSNIAGATVSIASGFLAGDTLNFADTDAITHSYDAADGVLTLTGSDSVADYQAALQSVTYSFAGDASDGGADVSRTIDWSVNDGVTDSNTATSTLDTPPCFVRGARILTDRGEVAVEDLRVGDIAITSSRRRRPIVWIGRRRLDLTRHRDPAAVRPVRVRAGAFGERLPRRDLWLSPGHSVACDDALTPISSLVNGRSVAQIEQDRVEYWHVELDAHDILLVEGLPAESYLDCGNREAFENGGAFVEAHPDFRPKHWAATCLPLVKEGTVVDAARARLLARLEEQGHSIDQEADAHILVDGLKIEPVRISDTRLAFRLPAGGREIALCSKVFVPAHAKADSADWRELGVCVGRLQIDGKRLVLDECEALGPGWHPAEFDGGRFARRWTRGVAALPGGARSVIVDLADFGKYWRDPQHGVAAARA